MIIRTSDLVIPWTKYTTTRKAIEEEKPALSGRNVRYDFVIPDNKD